MPGSPARYGQSAQPSEPALHELPPLKYEGALISVFAEVRRTEDGVWRGRLLFGTQETGPGPSTAEIFCAVSEADLWESVQGLREHHLRDLYRSVTERE
jgi:hypothetical protein